jgi:hypothetical protein
MAFYESLSETLHDMKDSAIGSGVYFLYGVFIRKTNFWKGFIGFVVGTITAQYLSPEVFKLLPNFSLSFISFVCGFVGMKLTESVVDLKIKEKLGEKFNKL